MNRTISLVLAITLATMTPAFAQFGVVDETSPSDIQGQQIDPNTFNAVQKQITSSPELMQEIATMAADPEIMAILNDPSLLQLVQSKNAEAIANNPKAQALMDNPKMQHFIQLMMKLRQQQQQTN